MLERAEIGLWAVADGAGGHERGDYASSRIIAALRHVDPALSGLSLVEEVKGSLAEVNRERAGEGRNDWSECVDRQHGGGAADLG